MPYLFCCKKYSKFFILLIYLCSVQITVSKNYSKLHCPTTDVDTSYFVNPLERSGLSALQELYPFEKFLSKNVSKQCKDSLIVYLNDIFHLKPWALEMLDASGKLPSSILSGTLMDYGSFDDCLNVRAYSEERNHLFKGKYCLIRLRHPLFITPNPNPFLRNNYSQYFGDPPDWIRHILENDISLRFGMHGGICMPSTCTNEDLYNVINDLAEPLDLDVTLTDCHGDEPRKMSFYMIFALVLVVVLSILCISGTILDFLDRRKARWKLLPSQDSSSRQLIKAFSLSTSLDNVFNVSSKKTSLDCIHGIRLLFCGFVVWAHLAVYPTFWKEIRYRNFHFIHEFLSPDTSFANNGVVLVEGFFVISAFLLVYTSWKKLEKSRGHIDILDNLTQKYWKFTPVHIFMIIVTFLLPVLNSAPVWDSTWEHENESCLRNGWKNVLFLQNFDSLLDMCWVHTWHVGATVQLLVISLPLTIFTFRYPKSGIFLNLSLFFGTLIYYYYYFLSSQYKFMSYNSLRYTHVAIQFLSKVYVKTSFHLNSNLIGMYFGWIYLKYGSRKISKVWLFIGWISCIGCYAYTFFGVFLPTEDLRIMALYNTTRSSTFSLATCWIIYVCASGQASVLDKAFSWKGFVPASRITYSIYLIHPLYLVFRDASITERFYMDKISQTMEMAPYIIVAVIASFIVHITVQEPSNAIYDILKNRKSVTSKPLNGSIKLENGHASTLNGTKKL